MYVCTLDTIINCYRQNIFFGLFLTSLVDWVLIFVVTQHHNINSLSRLVFLDYFP